MLKIGILSCYLGYISVLLRETTLTISDSFETASPAEYEIVRVVSLSATEITEITRCLKKPDLQGHNTLKPQ